MKFFIIETNNRLQMQERKGKSINLKTISHPRKVH